MIDVPLLTAFGAGLITFFAPCTFVTIPLFLTYIASQTFGNIEKDSKEYKKKVFVGALLYVIGFLIVFSTLGAVASTLGRTLREYKEVTQIIGGVLITIFGIFILFGDKIKALRFLYNDKKIDIDLSKFGTGLHIPFLLGITSAFAWTPCVGPILGSILTLAANTTDLASRGTLLLFVYALGINIPFLLIALSAGNSKKFIQKFSKFASTIYKISGIFLIVFGIMYTTGMSEEIFAIFFRLFTKLGYKPI